MAAIYRPCYATREEVMRALDVKLAQYNSGRIDRALLGGSESVDRLCNRKFYFEDATRNFDWPNYQYAYPWRVWFDQSELADITVNAPVVYSGGVLIDPTTIFWGDPTEPTAPYTYMELDLDSTSAFGNGPTPQREISVQGTFGYWRMTQSVAPLAASMGSTDATATVSDGSSPGVGDVMIVDNERMLVTDSAFIPTGINPSSGATTASAADNTIAVPSGGAFGVDEIIQLDSEWMLIQGITGNNLIVKRAWGGSVLAVHSLPVIYARRLLSVTRGALGTTAATHTNGATISISVVPAMVKNLALGEALVMITNEPAGYPAQLGGNSTAGSGVGGTGRNRAREPQPGAGIQGLRDLTQQAYGRQARSRVI